MIDVLWRSLDPAGQETIDRAWLTESRDRLNAFRTGKLKALEGEAAFDGILYSQYRHPDSWRKNLP